MRIKYEVKDIDFGSIDEAAIVNNIALDRVIPGFLKLGPQMKETAQARCPVSEETDFNPRVFHQLKLRPLGSLGGVLENPRAARLFELHGLNWRARAKAVKTLKDADLFQGTGANKGKTPDLIERQGGTIVGAFRHAPGTLKKSIEFEGVRHEGNQVRAIVRAHAPYAKAVHEGFTHKGGTKHTGRATRIAPRKFLKQSLLNIRDQLKSPATYEG